MDIAIREIGLTTQQVIASILQGLADLPGIGSAFSEAAQTTASVAIEMAERLAQARAGAESLRAPFDQAAEAARATAAAQREAADAVREGAVDGGVLGAVFRGAATAADLITAALGQAQDRLAAVTDRDRQLVPGSPGDPGALGQGARHHPGRPRVHPGGRGRHGGGLRRGRQGAPLLCRGWIRR